MKMHEAQKKKQKKIEPCGGWLFTKKWARFCVKLCVDLGGSHIMQNSSLVNHSIIIGDGTLLIFGMQITNF